MTYSLTIAWLYPDLMSTYGDRGNIIILEKRCQWRGIDVKVLPVDLTTSVDEIKKADIIFGGGAQDVAQTIVMKDLLAGKGAAIAEAINNGVPALLICGAFQLAGTSYTIEDNVVIEGVKIFDIVTKSPGTSQKRLIGNCYAKIQKPEALRGTAIVGFENHGGRTYGADRDHAFAEVLQGHGNNGEDGLEGAVYKNAIGSYLHGPLLSKNPEVADWLISTALEVKYKEKIPLEPLDDSLEYIAKKSRMNFTALLKHRK